MEEWGSLAKRGLHRLPQDAPVQLRSAKIAEPEDAVADEFDDFKLPRDRPTFMQRLSQIFGLLTIAGLTTVTGILLWGLIQDGFLGVSFKAKTQQMNLLQSKPPVPTPPPIKPSESPPQLNLNDALKKIDQTVAPTGEAQ